MALRLAALAAAAASAAAAAASLTQTPADSPAIHWAGRRVPTGLGGVQTDWEGVELSFTVTGASFIGLNISDASGGGAKLAVHLNMDGIPNPTLKGFRVATLITSPHQAVYTLASGASITGAGAVGVKVVLLTEPEFVRDDAAHAFVVEGVLTDGVLGAPPAPATARRMEFIGDSLTAGYGSAFDQPTPSTACGGGVLMDDVENDYSNFLCTAFSAECQWEAWSGISLTLGTTLPQRYPWTLGGVTGKFPYNFSTWVPDAIVINLGENDCNGNQCKSAKGLEVMTQGFITFVRYLVAGYGRPAMAVFLAIAPHEKGQSAAILPAVANLTAGGLNVHFLNATVTGGPAGCAGHPGPTQHGMAAARAQPQIAAVMGW